MLLCTPKIGKNGERMAVCICCQEKGKLFVVFWGEKKVSLNLDTPAEKSYWFFYTSRLTSDSV